jgi:hypothetical protein
MAGDVFGMQTSEVNPPRAAAAVPLAMVSLRLSAPQMHVRIDGPGKRSTRASIRLVSGFPARTNRSTSLYRLDKKSAQHRSD